jgi:hypothetical protein
MVMIGLPAVVCIPGLQGFAFAQTLVKRVSGSTLGIGGYRMSATNSGLPSDGSLINPKLL